MFIFFTNVDRCWQSGYSIWTCVCDDSQDATTNDVPQGLFNVKGFPTLYLHTATGENIRYDGDRSQTGLSEFIKKHKSASLKSEGSTEESADAKDEL